MHAKLFTSWAILVLPILLVFAGCGKGRTPCVPVAGQVLLDGKPVPTGFIRVIPTNGRTATGTIDADGRFRLTTFDEGDGCIRGTHAVEVISKQRLSATEVRWLVPKKYFDVSTSGYQVTIDSPTDSLRIELVSGGEKPQVEKSETSGDMVPGVTGP
jgi:hypothetical protein